MASDETETVDPLVVAAIQVLIEFKKNNLTYKETKKRFKYFTGLSDEITQKFNIGYASQTPTIIDENVTVNTTLQYTNSRQKNMHFAYLLQLI